MKILLDKQSDVILITRTGFGKSIIFQAAPLLFFPAKTALILMPLNTLEEEQSENLQAISGCRPFVLNGDTYPHSNIKMIREGRFTHSIVRRGISRFLDSATKKRFMSQPTSCSVALTLRILL